jgi:hypothetical protein
MAAQYSREKSRKTSDNSSELVPEKHEKSTHCHDLRFAGTILPVHDVKYGEQLVPVIDV